MFLLPNSRIEIRSQETNSWASKAYGFVMMFLQGWCLGAVNANPGTGFLHILAVFMVGYCAMFVFYLHLWQLTKKYPVIVERYQMSKLMLPHGTSGFWL